MTIVMRVVPSQFTYSGYYIGVLVDNGYTCRTSGFGTWIALLDWLRARAAERQDPAGRDLWNYSLRVSALEGPHVP